MEDEFAHNFHNSQLTLSVQFEYFAYISCKFPKFIAISCDKQYMMEVSRPKNLVVVTLNYCGIMNNPFEFYCAEFARELETLSQIFLSLLPLYFPAFSREKFNWNMGKIDQKIRTGRYSPAFDPETGIANNRFLSKSQFQAKWDQRFSTHPLIKEVSFSEQERTATRLYDFLIYHALLVFVYKPQPFEQLIKHNPDNYRQAIRPFYELSFLNEQRKLDKVMANFASLSADVFFIQEYSEQFKQAVQATGLYYTIADQTKDTLIIAKRLTFKVKYPTSSFLSGSQLKSVNWADRSAVAVLDKFILISAHLNSKLQKSKQQIEQMKFALVQLRRKHPKHQIIVGGDLNSFLASDKLFQQEYSVYPREEAQITTAKKRTMVQGQFHKGNKMVAESKDKIISSLPIRSGSVRYINNQIPNQESLIPTDYHPFDHYAVAVEIAR